MWAAHEGHAEVATFLLEKGAFVDFPMQIYTATCSILSLPALQLYSCSYSANSSIDILYRTTQFN